MLQIDIQHFGGRGSGSGRGGAGGTGGLRESQIGETRSLISERESSQSEVDATLEVMKAVNEKYGDTIDDIYVADVKKDSVYGYYRRSDNTIGINQKYFGDEKEFNDSYDDCVLLGYHPSRGKKTALQAVVAHELGHSVNQRIAEQLNMSLETAADHIVNEAKNTLKYSSTRSVAMNISRYAMKENCETVAEAFADVYCNGGKARKESKVIVDILDDYIKNKKTTINYKTPK